MFTLTNEPQGIGRILDKGFRLMMAGIGTAALLLVIMIIVEAVLFAAMGASFFTELAQLQKGQIPPSGLGMFIVFMVLLGIVSMLFNNAMTAKYGAVAYGHSMSLGQSIAIGTRKVLPVLIYGILYALIIGISALPLVGLMALLQPHGFLAFLIIVLGIIPPIILSLSLIFGNYLIILDNAGIIESLKRSHNLVWGNWWRTAVYFTIIIIIMMAIMFAVELTFGILIGLTSNLAPHKGMSSFDVIMQVLNQLVSMIFMPVMISLFIPYFHDLKLRKEGGDLAARVKAI